MQELMHTIVALSTSASVAWQDDNTTIDKLWTSLNNNIDKAYYKSLL